MVLRVNARNNQIRLFLLTTNVKSCILPSVVGAYAFVADLVGSRRAPERPALAQRVERAILRISQELSQEWRAPLTTTRGLDEVSGLLRRPDRSFDAARMLNEEVWPLRFRVAVSYGVVDIRESSANAGDMDGPAFHAAADALLRAKEHGLVFALSIPGDKAAGCELAEELARLHATLMEGWTSARARLVASYRRHGRQADVAKELGVTQQAVSSALRKAHLHELVAAEDALRRWLSEGPVDRERITT